MKHVDMTFNSITEMPRYIDTHPDLYNHITQGSFNMASEEWDGNVGRDGALGMARSGGFWPEGAARMTEVVTSMADLKDRARIETIENDVAGHMPDIDAYIAGQPDNMLSLEEGDELESPVISIGVHIGRAASVSQEQAMNRGAAILSIIDDIEQKGLRVELWAIWRNQWEGDSADIRVLLKRADQTWSPHSVAFALCHGGMNRRLIFATVEGIEGLPRLADGFGISMEGRPNDMDIWFPRVDGASRYSWDTPAKALESATATFNKQLKEKDIER